MRSFKEIVLSVALSGIAANLLHGGRTVYSRFKVPLNVDKTTVLSVLFQIGKMQFLNYWKKTRLIV